MSATDELGTIVDGETVRFERVYPAPVARVWWFLTDHEGMAAWFADADLEPRTGGRIEMRWEGAEAEVGEVIVWEPERMLEFTWQSSGEESLVRYELTAQGDRTRLVLTHTRLAANRLAGYGAGWDAHLLMLTAACEGSSRTFDETFERLLPVYRERVAEASRSR